MQKNDALVKVEEDKDEKLTTVTSIEVQTDGMVVGESIVVVSFSVHYYFDGEPQVKLSFQVVEQGPLQAS